MEILCSENRKIIYVKHDIKSELYEDSRHKSPKATAIWVSDIYRNIREHGNNFSGTHATNYRAPNYMNKRSQMQKNWNSGNNRSQRFNSNNGWNKRKFHGNPNWIKNTEKNWSEYMCTVTIPLTDLRL